MDIKHQKKMKTLLMKILESNFLFPSLFLCWTFIHKVAESNPKKKKDSTSFFSRVLLSLVVNYTHGRGESKCPG